jgi:hypothetical protein
VCCLPPCDPRWNTNLNGSHAAWLRQLLSLYLFCSHDAAAVWCATLAAICPCCWQCYPVLLLLLLSSSSAFCVCDVMLCRLPAASGTQLLWEGVCAQKLLAHHQMMYTTSSYMCARCTAGQGHAAGTRLNTVVCCCSCAKLVQSPLDVTDMILVTCNKPCRVPEHSVDPGPHWRFCC